MIQIKQKQAGKSTAIAINGEKASSWVGGRTKWNMQVCWKSEVEMWLASGMGGLHRARQVRIM